MSQKILFFLLVCSLAVNFLVFNEYLNYISTLTKETVMTRNAPREKKDSKSSGFGHNFTMIYDVKPKMNSTKYAIFWGYYILTAGWGHADETFGEAYLKAYDCPVTDCVFTHKIDLLPNIYDYDALIFNAYNRNFSFPTLRSPHQLYIMTANE
jgi:hypothetical protein